MRFKTKLFDIKIDMLFLIVIFVFFLSKVIRNKFSYFFISYLFIVFHESSHMLVASILGKKIDIFNITLFGVNISFKEEHFLIDKNKDYKKEYINNMYIYSVGPISNFALAFMFNKISFVFDINMFLGFLNIIPVYPLDGYNIVRNFLLYIGKIPEETDKIIKKINDILIIILIIIGSIIFILFLNPLLLFFLIYLIIIKKNERFIHDIAKNYK